MKNRLSTGVYHNMLFAKKGFLNELIIKYIIYKNVVVTYKKNECDLRPH